MSGLGHFNLGRFGGCMFAMATAFAIGVGGIQAASAAEIATDPGDYQAAPSGTNLGILYGQYANRNAYYQYGKRTSGSFKLESDIGLARLVHFMDVLGITIDPQVIVPFGRVDLKTAFGPLQPVSTSGVGDPIFGGTAWLYNHPEEKQWFGLTALGSVPMGAYNKNRGPVNIGENRWKGIFQAAYIRPIIDDFMIDVIGEYNIYGDNNNFIGMNREQDPSYGLQTHVRYMFTPMTYAAMTYYHDWGGKTRLNGISQGDSMDNDRWQATIATFVTDTVQAQLQGGTGISTRSGGQESARVNLRLLKVF